MHTQLPDRLLITGDVLLTSSSKFCNSRCILVSRVTWNRGRKRSVAASNIFSDYCWFQQNPSSHMETLCLFI